ncbi:MAG TPA: hypothetical protein VK211_23320 [Kamptonema sp.]|nr:hypothetical protein [Kamptonema sp.]
MSYSSRYQSRLLNFISQQSRKVVDKCDRALRHLKFAAEGAVQATLYPVYLLLQTARAIGRQLQQVGKKTAAQLGNTVNDDSLNAPEADAPIQKVLSFLEKLSLPGSTTQTKTEEISAVNYRDTAPFTAPNLGENGQAELPVFKDLIATSADALAKLDNKLEKSSDSPLLALGAAPEIPNNPIGETVKLGFINASAEAVVQLDKSLDSCSPAPEIAIAHRPQIVGIATAIATRNLVLVAPENQTLDILTAQQQQELQQKILSEVAEYWQQRQRLVESQIGFTNDLQLVANRANLFGLFRQFLGVMSWVQTSPVAVKINLFGEANLLLAKIDNSISNYQLSSGASLGVNGFQQLAIPLLPTNGKEESAEFIPPLPRKHKSGLTKLLSFFSTNSQEDSTEFSPPLPKAGNKERDYQFQIANSSLPSVRGAIAPIAPSQELPKDETEKYTKYLTVKSLGFLQSKQPEAGKITHQEEKPTKLVGIERFEDYLEQTIELILSAITYFFGGQTEQSEKDLAEHLYTKYRIPETFVPELDTIKSDRTTEETALTWSDLFGQTSAAPPETTSLQEKFNLLAGIVAETSYAPPSETLDLNPASATAPSAIAQNLAKVNTASTVSTAQTTATAVAKEEQAESSSVKPAPDWWEAQVISRGYVKHPLEQTLEWLDIALLWLEEIGVELWNWAKIQLAKIFSSKN